MLLAVRIIVEVPEHRRIAHDAMQEIAKTSQCSPTQKTMLANEFITPECDPDAGGKETVPEERQPISHGIAVLQHAAQPAADMVQELFLVDGAQLLQASGTLLGGHGHEFRDPQVVTVLVAPVLLPAHQPQGGFTGFVPDGQKLPHDLPRWPTDGGFQIRRRRSKSKAIEEVLSEGLIQDGALVCVAQERILARIAPRCAGVGFHVKC